MRQDTTNINLSFEQAWGELMEEMIVRFGRQPDLQTLLFLIGIQELGQLGYSFTKEEKEDLMHIAVCELLSSKGYFIYMGRDEEGWPHYHQQKELPQSGRKAQESLLKEQILRYFGKSW